ncbi:MAG: T9SS type A sorting domain-containing protein [Sediminibacterium sp.]|nr:T9SS type A sorting domain-containing protein [Sediminibacterium sp.]
MAYKGFVIKVGKCSALGTNKTPAEFTGTIFPNPVRVGEVVTVEGRLQEGMWELSTVSGVTVCRGKLLNRQLIVPPSIPAGMYILRTGIRNNTETITEMNHLNSVFRLLILE